MKSKIILILTIALFVVECKTVKQAQSNSQTNTTQNNTVKESNVQHNDIALEIDSSKQTVDKGQVSEVVNEETTTTNFSAPDSTGKQHVTSVTTTKRGITRNENKNMQENKQNKTNMIDKSDYKSDSKSNNELTSKSSDKQTSVATSTPKTPWALYGIITVVVGLLFVGFYPKIKEMKWFIDVLAWFKNLLKL